MLNWIKEYITSPTHKWWVDNVWKPSWTRLWNAIYGIPSALMVVWSYLEKYAGDTTVSQYLDKLHVPNGVFMALSAIALIGYLAHGRD